MYAHEQTPEAREGVGQKTFERLGHFSTVDSPFCPLRLVVTEIGLCELHYGM